MTESPKIVELQQKFEVNPPRYFASLANEYRKAGDFQRAISICGIYLEKLPAHIAGHVVLGQALHAAGRMDEAAESFKTVLALDPENLIALKCMGDIAQSRGDLIVAHDNFRQVLTADPRDHDTNRRLRLVEVAMKVAATEPAQEWIPPRISGEFAQPEMVPAALVEPTPQQDPIHEGEVFKGDLAEAAPDDSPHQSLEVDNLPALEPPAIHEDVPEDDFLGTLMPDSETEHHPSLAEPVALESSEELLAVPDLMDEAGESPAVGDNLQYRTAEFSLPSYGASELESAAEADIMESEAAALMKEAEISPPPPPPVEDEISGLDHPMRTGEFSLSRDTSEWTRELGESPVSSTDEGVSHEVAGVEPAGPFITETVAELYLQQGFTGEALLVYRQLARSKPNDQRIADRITVLEERLADEHAVRQAALDTPAPIELVDVAEPSPEPIHIPYVPEASQHNERRPDFEEFDRGWAAAPVSVPLGPENEDWFAAVDVAPARPRQTVEEFFAVLGRAKPEIRRKPDRMRVTADEIGAAAEITAGFGAFGIEARHPAPRPMPESRSADPNPKDDVLRFRAWLDGLSDS